MKRNLTFILFAASLGWAQTYPGQTSLPKLSGLVFMVVSGTCPSGMSTEVTALNGAMLQGTIAANGDVGGSGGSNSITPTGTVSAPVFTGTPGTVPAQTFTGTPGTVPAQTFTGTPGTVPAETFTGSALATHTHTLTPTGTNATQSITSASTEVPVTSPTKYVFSTLNSAAAASSSPSITIPAEVFTGSQDTTSAVSGGTPAGTNGTAAFTPAGTNGTAAFTPAGSNSTAVFTPAGSNSVPTFSGVAFDPHPAFVKVIFCQFN